MNLLEFLLTIAVIALVVIAAVLGLTKKGRMYAKAAFNALFKDANKNPKIVAEYFDEKIDQLRESYKKADNAYRKAVGEKTMCERKIRELEAELERVNNCIINANKHGEAEDARRFAREAMSIKAKLEAMKESLPGLDEAIKSAGDLKERAENAIQEVKDRKEVDLTRAQNGKAAQEIYSQFDQSRISSDIDKVLADFSDYADEQEKLGIGAKASWEDSTEARKIASEKKVQEYAADDYIASLIGSMTED